MIPIICCLDSREAYDYSIMATGVNGSGKSEFCNFICAE